MLIRITAGRAGRFISRGYGRHITRTIPSWEIIVVLKGELKMFLDCRHDTISPGNAILLPAQMRHGGDAPYPPGLSFYWLHFFPKTQQDQSALTRLPTIIPIPKPERLSQLFQLYLTIQDDPLPDQIELDLMAQLILQETTRTPPASDRDTTDAALPPLLQQLRKILVIHYQDPLTTSYLAQKLHCNPDYLGRLHHRYFHETISHTLNRIRVKHATNLLIHTNQSINEIAYNVGFADLRYFRRVFYHFHAMAPTVYRKLMIAENINTE